MRFTCPECGATVRIPRLWAMGVEMVFVCQGCKRRFKTGYKLGAVLSALALTFALVTTNLCAWLLSSYSIPLVVLTIIPLWLLYGFTMRRWWLLRRNKKRSKE